MRIQSKTNNVWINLENSKSKVEKKKIIDEIINPKKTDKEENSNLTPRETEIKKQIVKLNSNDIASKVARGEYVSDKDLRELGENDPDLLAKSKYMNDERKSIENKVRNARTKKLGKEMLANERQGAICIAMAGISNGNGGATGIAMVSAVDKAEENTSADLRIKEKAEIERGKRKRINKLI